eukprot:1112257-Rhodomonas_salina.1
MGPESYIKGSESVFKIREQPSPSKLSRATQASALLRAFKCGLSRPEVARQDAGGGPGARRGEEGGVEGEEGGQGGRGLGGSCARA